MGSINIVVTCSNRKRVPTPPELMIRNMPSHPAERRERWVASLQDSGAEPHPAHELYSGEHWSIVKRIAELAGFSNTWVLSAGYGLVPYQAPLKPYSATFSPGNLDSIVPTLVGARNQKELTAWWDRLAEWGGPSSAAPRSLAHLVAMNPRTPILIAASPPYLAASRLDLEAAQEEIADPDRFLVLSIGAAGSQRFRNVLPADARLERRVGGTRGTLNVRTAEHLLEKFHGSLRYSAVCEYLERLLADLPPARVFSRAPHSDEQVREFIRREIGPGTSATGLLRRFRDQGNACEQSRFRRLYLEIEKEVQ